MLHIYSDTVKLADGTIKDTTKLTRREILENLDNLRKQGMTESDISKLWSYSKR